MFLRSLFVTFGLLLGALFSEVVIRVFNLAPEVVYIEKWRMRLSSNPKIGYEPIPHLDSRGKSLQYYGYRGLSNNHGFRDVTHRVAKPKGTKRVLVLGDSIVAGLWIEKDKDVYPALLQEQLRANTQDVEVLNFGVSGYNTQQEVETLIDKGLQYKPDLVILTYCLNDTFADDGGMYYHLKKAEQDEHQGALNKASLHPLLRQSALFRFFRFRVFPPKKKEEMDPLADGKPDFLTTDATEKYFSILQSLSKENAFQVLVVLFPDFDFIDGRTASYDFFPQHTKIAQLSEKNGFEYLDLYDPVKICKQEDPSQLVSFDRYHPRPMGNACVANAVAEKIRDIGL